MAYAPWFDSAVSQGLVRDQFGNLDQAANAAYNQGNQSNNYGFAYDSPTSMQPYYMGGQGGGGGGSYGGGSYGGGGGMGQLYGGFAGIGTLPGFGGNYGGGYGGSNALQLAMFNAGNQQYNDARTANLDRYNMILGGMATTPLSQPAGGNPANFTQEQLQRNAQIYGTNGGYQGLYQRGMDYLKGQGTYATNRINEQYDNMNQSQMQNLTDRGLTNSTALTNAQNAVERERGQALQSNQESLNRQYLATDSALSGQVLGFMERRNDTYPNVNQMTSLAYQLGKGGGGGGAMYPTGSSSSMYYAPGIGQSWSPGQAAAASRSNGQQVNPYGAFA